MKFLNESIILNQEQWAECHAFRDYINELSYLNSNCRFSEAKKLYNEFLNDSDISLYVKYLVTEYFENLTKCHFDIIYR